MTPFTERQNDTTWVCAVVELIHKASTGERLAELAGSIYRDVANKSISEHDYEFVIAAWAKKRQLLETGT